MKNSIVKFAIIAFLGILPIVSCNKENPINEDEKTSLERYLEFRTKMNASGGSTDQSSEFMTVIGASQLYNKSLKLKSQKGDDIVTDSVPSDTTDYWEYWTCATVTETDNGDGTFTTIYDYGDGCDEYGSMTKGKITYIWSNEGNEYYSKVIYDHYYSYGMEMNGFSEYTFTSDENSYFEEGDSGDSTVSIGIFYWSGTSTGKDNITMVFDSGEKYSYISNFSNKWENSSYTVLVGEYYYKSELDGYEYHYNVTNPLVYNYECPNTWVPVSGVETIYYKDSTETYSFLISYGDGACDNLAVIIENGQISVVDFGELLYIYCEDDASSVVSNKNKH